MKIRILSSAIEDLYRGRNFYEKQGEKLGDYFLDSLFSDIDSLSLYGGIHPLHFGYYRKLSKKFPFAIYYSIENENSVLVWRILDMRQNPKKVKKEVKENK